MKKVGIIFAVALMLAIVINLSGPQSVNAAGPATIDLGSAGNFSILAKSQISTIGITAIRGDIGGSPIVAAGLTGFELTMHSSNTYATSTQIMGKAYAADYAAPTPETLTKAIGDMETAYTAAAKRTNPTATELSAGNLGGLTITPGLYSWSSDVTIPTDLTLAGRANDIWIFQIAKNLTTSSATKVNLMGGASPANIFWQVAGQTTLGSGSTFNGTILDKNAIVFEAGAILNGRALTQTSVTLDANTVTMAGATSTVATPTTTNKKTPAVAGVSTALAADPSLPNSGLTPKQSTSGLWIGLIGLAVLGGIVLTRAKKLKLTHGQISSS